MPDGPLLKKLYSICTVLSQSGWADLTYIIWTFLYTIKHMLSSSHQTDKI